VDAVVVGAGVAGLAAALELQNAGCEVSVVDPSDRPGGVMRTDHVSGYVIERGPNTLQVGAPMLDFLRRRNLEEDLLKAAPPAACA
jgi:oxygen-dependent protoporphyrinogen oxidase